MKRILAAVPAAISCALVGACAGTSGLRVESEPAGADVSVSVFGQAPRKVGQTPYVAAEALGNQPVQITVSKDGYKSESILVPSFKMAASGRAYAKLEPLAKDASSGPSAACAVADSAMQELSSGVAEAQALIGSRNLDEAERKLNALAARHSSVSVVYDLLGNVHYMKKDVSKALAAYKRSLEIAPGRAETERIIKKLQDIRQAGGGR